jgi:hypothetical protein
MPILIIAERRYIRDQVPMNSEGIWTNALEPSLKQGKSQKEGTAGRWTLELSPPRLSETPCYAA